LLNRTTIIIAAVLAVLVGAGSAGAATLLSGNRKDPPRPTAGQSTAAGTPGATTPAPSASGGAKADSISLSAIGDVVMGLPPGGFPPNNGKGFFDQVQSLLKADFQMANLEQTITEDTGVSKCGSGSTNCHAFRTPPPFAQNLKDAGFHLVNMANNHAYDFGPAGYKNTQAALDGVGIKYTGWPGQITVVDVKGVKVAVVGFASYTWSNLCSDLASATKVITEAAGKADVVVVQVHMGAEGSGMTHVKPGTEIFLGENRCDPIKFSHTVIDAGADLVVGHGPHVLRGMEFYKGRLIAYSMGNFAGYKALISDGVLGVTGVIRVSLTRDGSWAGGTLIPTRVVSPGFPRPDPKNQAISMITSLTKQDFPQTGAKIDAAGAITQ
jgi:poly-gamma-glutamate capsule biosynthesis protein CapA/YwtB (metallophosphatase superfamily)